MFTVLYRCYMVWVLVLFVGALPVLGHSLVHNEGSVNLEKWLDDINKNMNNKNIL